MKKTLEAVKSIYRDAKYAGIACGIKNVGIGNGLPEYGKAMLEVRDDGTVAIYTGFTEMGQGLVHGPAANGLRRDGACARRVSISLG